MRFLTISLVILIQLFAGCSSPTSSVGARNQPSCDWPSSYCSISFSRDFLSCLECAEAGDANAAFCVAKVYKRGKYLFGLSDGEQSLSIKKDANTALKWYKIAADLGHIEALKVLFDNYYSGELGPENKDLAQQYLEKAANAKCEWAMLLSAEWSEEDKPERAIDLYLKLALMDNMYAQSRLADLSFEGEILPQDICTAYFWTLLADAGGYYRESENHLWGISRSSFKSVTSTKRKLESILDSEQIKLVQNSAAQWQKGQTKPEFPIVQTEKSKEPSFVSIIPKESITISKRLTPEAPVEWFAANIDVDTQLNKTLSPSKVFDLLNSSVWVVISAATKENLLAMNNVALGSAVAISEDKLLTNWHVVEKMPYVLIKHGEQFIEAEIYAGDKRTDRCILLVDDIELKPVKAFRKYNSLSVGEVVYSIGSPKGLENTLGQGIISGKRDLGDSKIIQTTAQVSPGSSGGGLFDSYGNLIGITTFKLIDSEGLNFAIPIEDFAH